MKIKQTFALAGLLLLAVGAFAQHQVVLESGTTTTVYDGNQPFVDAYNAAINGDIIYLPGISLTVPPLIDKSISIYGTGHYPAATGATGVTLIVGHLNIGANADNLHLEGIDFGNNNIITGTNAQVENLVIKRCSFVSFISGGNLSTPCINVQIIQNVLKGDINFSNTSNSFVTNNIIEGRIWYGENNFFTNNIFLYEYGSTIGAYAPVQSVDNSSISHNVFYHPNTSIANNCESSTFSYNIFRTTPTTAQSTFEANNYYNIDISTVFIDQTGNDFSYDHDYHLTNDATYSVGGTLVGIYGGSYPYKTNAVPVTPQITAKTIATSTDASGQLSIDITATAQEE